VEIYEIDDVVKQVRKSREPDYKAMWNELKHRIEILKNYNRNRRNECIDRGDGFMAETYSDWYIEDRTILNIMSRIEKEYNFS